jgi:tRNA pseudouridine55 synthase
MGKRTSGLAIDGIVLLDKRQGISSNKALQEVRRLFNANKAGHTGSLDPLATGLLPLCFGEATKVSAFMLDDDKAYEVTLQLGVMTDSGDSEGQIVRTLPVPTLSDVQIKHCLQHFTGPQLQVPPMYSALKHNGKKLYELARAGVSIDRPARPITIYAIDLLDAQPEQLSLAVRCSKGTYIRSLAEDIGQYLGTCATVTQLRRTASGSFSLDTAYTLEQLQAMDSAALTDCLLPLDSALDALPRIELSSEQAARVALGQRLILDTVADNDDAQTVRLYCPQGFMGFGELSYNGKLQPTKRINQPALSTD